MPPANQNQNPGFAPRQSPSPTSGYDFFLNPAPVPRKPLLRFNGSPPTKTKRLMIMAGGGVLLIIILIFISSLFGGGSDITPLVTVAQDQTELARVAAEASGQANLQTTKNLGQTVDLSLTSAQQQLLAYLKTNGHSVGTSQLNATKDTSTDKKLTTATADSNFDAVFTQVIQTKLQSYIRDVNAAAPAVGAKGKILLKNEYTAGQLLLTQAEATISSLQSQ